MTKFITITYYYRDTIVEDNINIDTIHSLYTSGDPMLDRASLRIKHLDSASMLFEPREKYSELKSALEKLGCFRT